MKKLSLALFVLFCLNLGVIAGSQAPYVAGSFILKFKANSEQYQQWLSSGRHAQITELSDLFGSHTTEGYLGDATLHLLSKKYHERLTTLSVDDPGVSLQTIAIVNVPLALNLDVLIAKVRKLNFVEYSELMPARYTCSTPNDSLFADLGQYYIKNTRANDAWDLIPGTNSCMIAIVDTGVDYNHEDLKDVTFTNAGEMGTDAQGKDKRTNGVDDDKNGFIDDWHGWDFAGNVEGAAQDNDPRPGYLHGTHCAGIAGASVNNVRGIAGMCNRASILAVKIGTNNATLIRSYEGIAYAAGMGAPVVSCSWGGPAGSQAEQEIINAATKLGSLVIVAAGNDGVDETFYPAGYKNVLSVAAVGRNDVKASFSNYGNFVGISAPGVYILSTIPGGGYDYMDGTSMATPCVAGAAAIAHLKYPNYSPSQLSALLRATADNVDTKTGNRNSSWMYKIGSGRVNAFRAITVTNARLAQMIDVQMSDADGDGAFDAGNTISIMPSIQNLLTALGNAKVKIEVATSGTGIVLSDGIQTLGAMAQTDIKQAPKEFSFVVPDTTKENSTVNFNVTIYDDSTIVGRSSFSLYLRPTYRTLRNNNITITVNSRGNFAFNDYSANFQGEGFRYKNSASVLFEAGLMVGTSANSLSDVVRGNPASNQDSSFGLVTPAFLKTPGILANTECTASFQDKGKANDAHVSVKQTMLQYKGNGNDDFVISVYDLTNTSGLHVDSMFCGIYADWDIDQSGTKNLAVYDEALGFYYVKATVHDSLPWVGMQLLTKQPLNMFMMDNDGTTADNPGVYDNFTAEEKFQTMSSGIARTQSNITDVSTVIGAGPFSMESKETVRVAFSFFAGYNLEDLKKAAKAAKDAMLKEVSVPAQPSGSNGVVMNVVPNPVGSGSASLHISLPEQTILSCEIVDILGRHVGNLANNQQESAGSHIFALNSMSSGADGLALSRGTYFIRLYTQYGTFVEPFIVLP